MVVNLIFVCLFVLAPTQPRHGQHLEDFIDCQSCPDPSSLCETADWDHGGNSTPPSIDEAVIGSDVAVKSVSFSFV